MKHSFQLQHQKSDTQAKEQGIHFKFSLDSAIGTLSPKNRINFVKQNSHSLNDCNYNSSLRCKTPSSLFLSKIYKERQKSSEYQAQKYVSSFQEPTNRQNNLDLIPDSQIKDIFNTKFILIKKGKILKKPILRFAQLSAANKILYFASKNSKQPKGFYSLYQSFVKLVDLDLTPQLKKLVNFKQGTTNVEAIHYASLNFETVFYLLAIPGQENNCNLMVLKDLCELGVIGELQSYLEQRNIEIEVEKNHLCSLYFGGLSKSVNFRESEISIQMQNESPLNAYFSKEQYNRNQRLLPHLSQSITLKQVHPSYSRLNSSSKVNINGQDSLKQSQTVIVDHFRNDKSNLEFSILRGQDSAFFKDEGFEESEIDGEEEGEVGGRKAIKQMKKGCLNASTPLVNLSQINIEKQDQSSVLGHYVFEGKVVQFKKLKFGAQEQYEKVKTKLNEGDNGDEVIFSEEDENELNQIKKGEDLVEKIMHNQRNLNNYDQCSLSSLIMYENQEGNQEFDLQEVISDQDGRLQTIQNLDSNLNSINDDFSKLSLNAQVNQLKEEQNMLPHKFNIDSPTKVTNVKDFLLDQMAFIDVLHDTEDNQVLVEQQQIEMKSQNLCDIEKLYLGIYESWNFKLDLAKTLFKSQDGKQNLRSMLHNFELSLLKALITGKKSLVDKCLLKLTKLELIFNSEKTHFSKMTQVLTYQKVQSPAPHIKFFNTQDIILNQTIESIELLQTELLMFKAILKFLQGNRFKAFLIFRECWKSYKKYEPTLTKPDPPYWFDPDLKSRIELGLGMFYLGISVLPKSLQGIVKLVGFQGNRTKGLAYLKSCIDEQRCRAPIAALILSLFLLDQEQCVDDVCKTLLLLTSQFPQSSLFLWLSSIVSWKFCQLDDAVYFIQRALTTCPPTLAQEAAFLKYEVGWFHYLKLEFEQSLFRFKEVLRDCLHIDYEDDILDQLQQDSQSFQSVSGGHERSKVYDNFVSKMCNKQQSQGEFTPIKAKGAFLETINQKSPSLNSVMGEGKKEDFVYLPHRACLAMQMAGAYIQLGQRQLCEDWLKTTIRLAHQPALTRSKLDQDMGNLAQQFLHTRKKMELLTYEIIYFLHQIPKLPNAVLLQIIANVSDILKQIQLSVNCQDPSEYKDSEYLVEFVSGVMLIIICYCFLGDTEIAILFSDRLVKALPFLGQNSNYLAVHAYYWAARAHFAEDHFRTALQYLLKAKKIKKYDFPIDIKIDRVIQDCRQNIK